MARALPRRRRARPQTIFLDPVAKPVPGDSEPGGSSRDIAVRRVERVEQPLAFHDRDSVVEAQCLLGGSRHRIRRGWLGDGSRGQCQARGGDHRSIRKQSRPLEDVAELADISGPAVTEQRRASVGSQRLARQAVVNADASQEMLGERGDVLRALAQRRQRDGQDSQAVIEILAEAPGVDGGGQLLAAGREDPDVDGLAPGAAESADGLLLDHLQELGLESRGQ